MGYLSFFKSGLNEIYNSHTKCQTKTGISYKCRKDMKFKPDALEGRIKGLDVLITIGEVGSCEHSRKGNEHNKGAHNLYFIPEFHVEICDRYNPYKKGH